jgi:60 kDa SS-A/Ro ribonucleoprotein
MRMNQPNTFSQKTHEGAPAARMTAEQALRRSVLSCMLWEREFYEDGQSIADRINTLADQVNVGILAPLAIEARSKFNLRHVPLLLLTALIRRASAAPYGGMSVASAITETIQRADELTELLALYWRKGKTPLSKQLKLGLGEAFSKFDEYALAKYDRANAVRLRDVLFLTHPKPKDEAQAALWKRLVDNELVAPDTWEVALSGGADKKETFERLLREGTLGYLALLRNLRNMANAGVETELVRAAILARKGAHRVLPFRYVAAARAAPQFELFLDMALTEAIADMQVLPGKTAVLVDVSGSMDAKLSERSDLTRRDAAAALASIIPGDIRMFSFSNGIVEVPPRRGMAGVDAIVRSQAHSGTNLSGAVEYVNHHVPYDRLIVISDEQAGGLGGYSGYDNRNIPAPVAKGYMINVASAKNGVGYGQWVHLDGFSESVLRFIAEHERAAT